MWNRYQSGVLRRSLVALVLASAALACGDNAEQPTAQPSAPGAVSDSMPALQPGSMGAGGNGNAAAGAAAPGGNPAEGAAVSPSEGGPASPPLAAASDPGMAAGGTAPSAGCGKAGRPEGGAVTVEGDHIYQFPPNYDGATPLPVVFAFHANNNPIDQLRTATRGSGLEQNFVMVFPKSVGSGWSLQADATRLDGWYDDLLANYCVDTRHVFATGHSSGAQFIVQLLCRGGEGRFTAIAPVASSAYCANWDHPIPTLLIHGANDMERANTSQDADGRKDLAPYVASNACGMTSAAVTVDGCNSGGMIVDPGCVSFEGCAETLRWCSHNDPNYSMTNHGWPCFASRAMYDFFAALP